MEVDRVIAVFAMCLIVAGVVVSIGRFSPETSEVRETPVTSVMTWKSYSLSPVPNPDPHAVPQPTRNRPYRVAATSDGRKAYVTLSGKESTPGSHVAVIDVANQLELSRIKVGSYPYAIKLHPSGRYMVVANRYSNYLTVIDVHTDSVTSVIPVIPYCEEIEFSADGRVAYLANFWKNQILVVDLSWDDGRLVGTLRQIGFGAEPFVTHANITKKTYTCEACGWGGQDSDRCSRCGKPKPVLHQRTETVARNSEVYGVLRARCGTASCHLYESGGFVAGPDAQKAFASAVAHVFPGRPDESPLLRIATSVQHGGMADSIDGRHHVGGIVFENPDEDPDYRHLRNWIAGGAEGPGISVGDKPRDMAVSTDGRFLYVANTGSLDVSVVDLVIQREIRRIFVRSPVNDLVWLGDRLVFATLGVGSGHPKQRNPARESTDPMGLETEFTLKRDLTTGKPLPLDLQEPLGPYDDVDGTAQEKFRDISNDIVVLDPSASDVGSIADNDLFIRYTSDTFEALPGDKRGDVPEHLMRVVGAFPEQMETVGEHLYVTMSGTFQVQEWRQDGRGLRPGRVFDTGFKPSGIAVAQHILVVANHLQESVSFVNLKTGESSMLSLSRQPEPFPSTDFERGEFFVQTSVFSVDQDQSCVHCHYRDTSDGKKWSVSQVMGQSRDGQERAGGSREVPDMRGLFHDVPFFVEGTLSMDEPLTMIMEQNPLVSFQGVTPVGDFSEIFAIAGESVNTKSADTVVVATNKWENQDVKLADLIKRRDIHFARLTEKYWGKSYTLRDCQKFVGDYQGLEPRLLANPEDPDEPMVVAGKAVFEDPTVGCSGCHPPPAFTDKTMVYNGNKSFPPLVTGAPRDNVHMLISADRMDLLNGYTRSWDPIDFGRVEEHEGFFVAPSLRGLWARPPRLLHHGHAQSLREVVCTPGHPALRWLPTGQREQGRNEFEGLPDTHGVTSHLSVWEIECLIRYLRSIE
ncbi:MAG: hypothetical protein HUU55_16840 [Myxococcales bacterium]|nr:hypothetical protein [Myxococcales bacterium]